MNFVPGKRITTASTVGQRKVSGRIFFALRGEIDEEWIFADGTYVRAHQHSSGARIGEERAIGRSRGGATTKIPISSKFARECKIRHTTSFFASVKPGTFPLKKTCYDAQCARLGFTHNAAWTPNYERNPTPMHFSLLKKFAFSLSLFALSVGSRAHAQIFEDTLIFEGIPSVEEVETLSGQIPRHYKFIVDIDAPKYLDRILQLKNALSITVSTQIYPTNFSKNTWTKLAEHGVQFIAEDDLYYPTAKQAQILNEIEFKSTTLRFERYPELDKGDFNGLFEMTVPFKIIMDATRFPLAIENENFAKLHSVTSFEFRTDYWPRTFHVENFNTLAKPIHIQVFDFEPTQNDLPYLQRITHLSTVTVVMDPYLYRANTWQQLALSLPNSGVNVRWQPYKGFPDLEGLKAFWAPFSEQLATRSLLLPENFALSHEQKSDLLAIGGKVERSFRD
jgi:hypothetical protein